MTFEEYLRYLGKNLVLDSALIVGPYPTSGFFAAMRRIAGRGNPGEVLPRASLTVVADDGWDQTQLDEIRALYEHGGGSREAPRLVIRRVCATDATGLVHAKIYFLTMKNSEGTYTKQFLLLGSANASDQGFGTHAETFLSIDIADIKNADERSRLLKYLHNIEVGNSVEKTDFYLARNTWVMVPEIEAVDTSSLSGFDAWLRRGRLCHQYQPDNRFGRLALRLKNALPTHVVETAFKSVGWGRETESKVVSRAYVKLQEGRAGRVMWREQYFVETDYGHWASAKCYGDLGAEFVASRAKEREAAVTTIRWATNKIHEKWLTDYEKAVRSAARKVRARKVRGHPVPLARYFKTLDGGGIDISAYLEGATEKLKADRVWAGDTDFRNRFIAGYGFPKLPQLGNDYETFAVNWCQGLLRMLKNAKTKNRLAQKCEALMEQHKKPFPKTAQELLSWLRTDWNVVGIVISDYHN